MQCTAVLVTVAVAACVLGVGHTKSVVHYSSDSDSSQGGPKVHVGADGVSASFGGYSASAGLGGKVGDSGTGGLLFARAGTPDGTGASAGLGGSVQSGGEAQGGLFAGANAGSSGSTGGVVSGSSGGGSGGSLFTHTQTTTIQKPRPSATLYNDIFNIPTSVLTAVNRLLNNGGGEGGVHAGATVGGSKDAGVATRVGAGAFVETGSVGGGATAGTVTTGTKQVSTGLFNDIFNIPISALNAVNQLLNNNANAKNGK